MKNKYAYFCPKKINGKVVIRDIQNNDITAEVLGIREIMLNAAIENGQCLRKDLQKDRFYRKDMSQFIRRAQFEGTAAAVEFANGTNVIVADSKGKKTKIVEKEVRKPITNPVMEFIMKEADKLRPNELMMDAIKWKYLVRSVKRGKNIMMTGAAGCGKTFAAQQLVTALNRPNFYFNLGATQDPRGTLVGNTGFDKDSGTVFNESAFIQALQTPDAVILLDELSRAHPEAWNILMTVLDQGQRYLRIDEKPGSPIVKVADGVSFIATANIGNEYTATRMMDRALIDRFIIIEMDRLSAKDEAKLLQMKEPELQPKVAKTIAEIARDTYDNLTSNDPKLSDAISTRLSVEVAGLMVDGFSLGEAAEVCIYPFFDADGGNDSERTYIKQLIQRYDVQMRNEIIEVIQEEVEVSEDDPITEASAEVEPVTDENGFPF